MTTLNEGRYAGEFILTELPGTLSRDVGTVVVPANTTLAPGTVLGRLSASAHYAPYDDANSDGSETACAVLLAEQANAERTPAEATAVVIDFGAEVRADDLVWGDGVDEAGGPIDLAAVAIKARS